MTRKIVALSDYIPASQAAHILSEKLGRPIRPDYVRKLKNVRFVRMNDRCKLYHRGDIEACIIRKKQT
jgi:hypothetical protein